MAKKKVAVKTKTTKPRAPRKKKVAPPPEPVQVKAPEPPIVEDKPPYPLPTIPTYPQPYPQSYPQPYPPPYGPQYPNSDEMMNLSDIKKLWKTKTFWAAVCLFLLSLASIMFGLPQFASNPIIIGVGGVVISILWIVLRMATNQPVTPSINFPHPNEWFKKKPPG